MSLLISLYNNDYTQRMLNHKQMNINLYEHFYLNNEIETSRRQKVSDKYGVKIPTGDGFLCIYTIKLGEKWNGRKTERVWH
jgi:hypothetical protein